MNEKIDSIQAENLEWKQRMGVVEHEVEELKGSVGLVHGLLKDEKLARENSERRVNEKLVEKSTELGNSLKLLQEQAQEVMNTKDAIRVVQKG